jgi:hypothetical protein
LYQIDYCQCCTSRQLDRYPSLISPFIAHYVLGARPRVCELLECRECGHRFFDLRFEESEVARLYSKYRGEEYLRERHKQEFWYTKKINDSVGHDVKQIEARQQGLSQFLTAHINTKTIDSVLDYGGDRGQCIPDNIGRTKYVYEVSGAVPREGVSKISTPAGLSKQTYDLIMLCHVLEHCSDVRKMVETVGTLAAEQTIFYFELPYERFHLKYMGTAGWCRAYLNVLQRSETVVRFVDFFSTAMRIKANLIPPFGFVKLHEHINFFSEQSLRMLLTKNGFEVVACQVGEFRLDLGGLFLRCLAKKSSPVRHT